MFLVHHMEPYPPNPSPRQINYRLQDLLSYRYPWVLKQ